MHKIVLVLIDVAIVIVLSRLVGGLFRKIKQPLVIGEIVAGIMLGPSLLGWLAPDVMKYLFNPEVLPILKVLAEIGLIFFMFLIGLELDPKYLRGGNIKIAAITSIVSIVIPFIMAGVLASYLHPIVSQPDVSLTAFSLFLGAALSITAFPVLARIITESNLQDSRVGTLALTSAAVDDVMAWCLLAMAIAVTRTNNFLEALPTFGWSLLYIIFVLTVGRWLLKYIGIYYKQSGQLSQFMLAIVYVAVIISALITEMIGIHLIFGAFLIGVSMPKDNHKLVEQIATKTEDFVLIFLLPVFFAYSGLQTQIGSLNTPQMWGLCLSILAVAIIGKYVGTYMTARWFKIEKREAIALGWLMNTRGLTELIVLNIGLELKVISPVLFTMLAIMAIVTTFMTSPILAKLYPTAPPPQNPHSVLPPDPESPILNADYRVLVPIANPKTQAALLQLAVAIAYREEHPAIVIPFSTIELEENYQFKNTPAVVRQEIAKRQDSIQSIIDTLNPAAVRNWVQPIVRIGCDVAHQTGALAASQTMDLILVGWHRSAFSENRLGGRVGQILATAPTDVGVFIDRPPTPTMEHIANGEATINYRQLLVPYSHSFHDELALEIALRLLANDSRRQAIVLNVNSEQQDDLTEILTNLPRQISDRIGVKNLSPEVAVERAIEASQRADLTLMGTSRTWGLQRTLGRYADALAVECHSPALIVRRYSKLNTHIANIQTPIEGVFVSEAESATKSSTEASWDTGKTS